MTKYESLIAGTRFSRSSEEQIANLISNKPYSVGKIADTTGRTSKDVTNRISDLRQHLPSNFTLVALNDKAMSMRHYFITASKNVKDNNIIKFQKKAYKKVRPDLFVC